MPFYKDSHFSALEDAMNERVFHAQDIFLPMGSPERTEFCEKVKNLVASTPKIERPYPEEQDNFAYVIDGGCQQCPLWASSNASANGMSFWRSGVYGRGTGKNGIYIIGESPGSFEIANNEAFSGPGGSILSRALEKVGIIEEDCFITNIVRCRAENNRNISAAEFKACHKMHHEYDLPYGYYDGYGMGETREEWDPSWRPKLVIVLGRIALKFLMKMTKITQNRGVFFDYTFIDTPCKFIATWHPSKLLTSPELFTDFEQDLGKAKRFIEDSSFAGAPLPVTKALVSRRENCLQWLSFFLDNPPNTRLSVDIETTGLNYLDAEIVSFAITCMRDGKPYGAGFLCDIKKKETPESSKGWWRLDLDQRDTVEYQALKKILESYPLTFQNGDFDLKFFWQVGINVKNECDSMDAHLMLNEQGSHNLDYLVKAYIGESAAGYKETFKGTLGDKTAYHLADPVELLDYNIDDTYYTQILREMFLEMIEKEKLTDLFWNHAMPLQRTLTRMSYHGMKVNREVLMELASENRVQIKEVLRTLYGEVGGEFNVLSSPDVRNVLYDKLDLEVLKRTGKTQLPSTDKDVLEALAKTHEVPRMILEVRQLIKANSMYLDGDSGLPKKKNAKETGLLRFLDENDRVHTHFFPWGTVSGRLSASEPNMLNIPKKSVFRNLFIPKDGFVFIDGDYSQAELIVLAYLCGDKNLINAVNSSDLHSQVVKDLLGISEDDPEFKTKRAVAKQINFGKVYGAGPAKLVEQLRFKAGGIIITLDEAKTYHQKWDAMYPGVKTWSTAIHNRWRQYHELESIFGRKMHFPDFTEMNDIKGQQDNIRKLMSEKDRLSTNFPPQSAVGDAANRSLHLIDAYLDEHYGKWTPETCWNRPVPILSVYDEVLLEVPEELADEISKVAMDIMTIPVPTLNIPLRVEMDIRKSWGDEEGIAVEV